MKAYAIVDTKTKQIHAVELNINDARVDYVLNYEEYPFNCEIKEVEITIKEGEVG